ncbi:glycerophosphodiester phosphodiesterase family protein [Sphingomonas xinjiangensis]|uniref:Glycerophosphoryl diester phosphodiesterase n=1 Tax=Sphingomonas xinjiangensis TaxID=643568 RepID=A0A840YR17_9SPHN|nr:glycerophosphodiester phosphodiesterase family protein [Sphingomonas xinjiangensis]MBB5711612.1 glycerophosphoryl diester phosphodiesterase [Sphingomonas xinjiangensis]
MFQLIGWAAALTAALTAATSGTIAAERTDRTTAIRAKILDPQAGPVIIAHRGCHNPAPRHGLASTPENSLAALEQCIEIGVDVMETDIRRTRDGYLVIMHDETVDRTTNGHGRVSAMTIAQINGLRLRENEGGEGAALTDQRVLTLDQMLTHARGRIILNLDVKDAIFGEVAAAVRRANAVERVIVKAYAGIASPPLADLAPYDAAPFIAILSSADATGAELPTVLAQQGRARVRPIAYEVPRMPVRALPPLAAAARSVKGRLWANSLWEGAVEGVGGDIDALRDPDAVWGRLVRGGVTMIQTDEPEALRAYIKPKER